MRNRAKHCTVLIGILHIVFELSISDSPCGGLCTRRRHSGPDKWRNSCIVTLAFFSHGQNGILFN